MAQMIRHCGSRLVTPEELASIPIPAPMGSRHCPIPHRDVYGTLAACLGMAGLEVSKATLAVAGSREASAEGREEDLFGLLELAPKPAGDGGALDPTTAALMQTLGIGDAVAQAGASADGWDRHFSSEEYTPCVAFRHSNRQRFGFLASYGLNVTVCDNTGLWGGVPLAKFKHTSRVRLFEQMGDAVREVAGRLTLNAQAVAALKAEDLSDTQAKARLWDIFAGESAALPKEFTHDVRVAYFEPEDDWSDCQGRTAWALHNACTRALRTKPLHSRLGYTLDLVRHFPVLAAVSGSEVPALPTPGEAS